MGSQNKSQHQDEMIKTEKRIETESRPKLMKRNPNQPSNLTSASSSPPRRKKLGFKSVDNLLLFTFGSSSSNPQPQQQRDGEEVCQDGYDLTPPSKA